LKPQSEAMSLMRRSPVRANSSAALRSRNYSNRIVKLAPAS
jgi:hypothetical protein